MTERLREGGFGLLIVLVVLAGVGFNALADDVEPGSEAFPAENLVRSKAIFCAPSSAEEGSTKVALAPTSDGPVQVGMEPARRETLAGQPGSPAPVELEAGHALIAAVEDNKPVDAVGYGGYIAGSSMVASERPVAGAGAAPCSADASSRWLFAAGSTALGANERILLYNPFPDEAVVRLNFYTPHGLETRTSVSDVPVPAGSWESVAINEVIRAQGAVAVEVAATRGRVVAWREMFSRPDEAPKGVQLSLGATDPAREWYFPDGAAGEGIDERISVLNPNNRRAVVEIALVTGERILQPADLLDLTLPARTSASFSLAKVRTGLRGVVGGVGAIVRTKNGTGIVAERTVTYDAFGVAGTAAELGVTRPAKRWLLGPAAAAPTEDGIAFLNPGARAATVDVVLLEEEVEPLEPGLLQDLVIRPSTRLKVRIENLTDGRPITALVTSSRPLVAERWAYSAANDDVAAAMGFPLRPMP